MVHAREATKPLEHDKGNMKLKVLSAALALGVATTLTTGVPSASAEAKPAAAQGNGGPVVLRDGVIRDKGGKIVGGWAIVDASASTASTQTGGTSVTPTASVDVGGGTWHYGTYTDTDNYKHCWSFYYHPSLRHGATARFTSASSASVDAAAGVWANAEPNPFYSPNAGTCEVFWRVYT